MPVQRMRFVFDVVPDNGTEFRVVAGPRDISRWERTGKGRSLGAIERDAQMGQLEEIAYTAAFKQGLWSGPLNEFRDTCDVYPIDEDVEREAAEDGGADESGPTETAP